MAERRLSFVIPARNEEALIGEAMEPAALLAQDFDALRACGLSDRKTEYIADLAQHFVDGKIHARDWPRMSDEALIAEVLQLNFTSVVLMCQAVIPHMVKKGGGRVINVSSIAERFLSGPLVAATGGATATGSSREPPSIAQTSSKVRAVRTSTSRANAASAPLPAGTTSCRPARPAAMAAGRMPSTPRNSPVSPSSPWNSHPPRASRGTWPLAARIPRAMARSKRPPSLGRSAGARFTVIERGGNSNWELRMAARTRSFASRTAVAGRPTIDMRGRPPASWTSTCTAGAETPTRARPWTSARVMVRSPGRCRVGWRGVVPRVPRRCVRALPASPAFAAGPHAGPRIPRASPGPGATGLPEAPP